MAMIDLQLGNFELLLLFIHY